MTTPRQTEGSSGGSMFKGGGEDSSGLKNGQERRGNDEFCSQQAKERNPQNDL